MWRLWHRIFGWNYVLVEFGHSLSLARVEVDGDGRPYAQVCGRYFDLATCDREWVPLTFSRSSVHVKNNVVPMPREAS